MPNRWLSHLQQLLLPDHCLLCGQAAHQPLSICRDCQADLPRLQHACRQCALPLPASITDGLCGQCLRQPPAFDSTFALLHYRPPVDRLIQSLKFHDKLAQARMLGTLLAQSLAQRRMVIPDCIVPVPLSRTRLRERGFNQALELARPVSRQLQIPVRFRLLRRLRHTSPQSQLKYRDRQQNIRKAFTVVQSPVPAHIAVIDDVVTTASTCNEVAAVLKKAGARRVDIWCIARASKS